MAVLAEHLGVLGERADRGFEIHRDMRAAHHLGERLPAIAVVDEDRVDAGGECVERQQAKAERLARAGVSDDQAVVRGGELLIEEVKPEPVALGRRQEARAPRGAAPGGIERQEVGCVPRRAAFAAQLIRPASGQHREERRNLRHVLVEQLRIADGSEGAPCGLCLCIELVGGAGLEQHADGEVDEL